jgi:hypothetical protein
METKTLKSSYHGELDLNGFKISCAVLEDGTRILVNRSLATAIGLRGGGAHWQRKKLKGGATVPEYLSAGYLAPYISDEVRLNISKPISYINNQGDLTEGIPAIFLTDICDIYIKAGENGAFPDNQHIAEKAYKMLLAFSKIGIIALVDEATGYQYERENDELQKILKAYISEEILQWQKQFHDVFYKELFRLNGWDGYTVNGIKKRPSVIGTWTNTLIYEQLPKGVFQELKRKTPKSKAGNKTARYFQSLTLEKGEPHLREQINQVIAIFRISDNMEQMWAYFNKLNDRKLGILQLFETPFEFDKKGHTIDPPEPIDKETLSGFNKSLTTALEYNPNA